MQSTVIPQKTSRVLSYTGNWSIVRCRPQRERMLCRHLVIEGISHFLPTELVKSRERIPWPGHVFTCTAAPRRDGSDDSWWSIATALQRCGVSENRNPAQFIRKVVYPERLVTCLARYERDMMSGRKTYAENIQQGSRIEVNGGAFRNYRGVVTRVMGDAIEFTTVFASNVATLKLDRSMVDLV